MPPLQVAAGTVHEPFTSVTLRAVEVTAYPLQLVLQLLVGQTAFRSLDEVLIPVVDTAKVIEGATARTSIAETTPIARNFVPNRKRLSATSACRQIDKPYGAHI